MKVQEGEKVLHEETMTPITIAQVSDIHDSLDTLKGEAIVLEARLRHLAEEAKYLNKKKWHIIDAAHPMTLAARFDQDVCRRFDLEDKKVYVIEEKTSQEDGSSGKLDKLLKDLGAPESFMAELRKANVRHTTVEFAVAGEPAPAPAGAPA